MLAKFFVNSIENTSKIALIVKMYHEICSLKFNIEFCFDKFCVELSFDNIELWFDSIKLWFDNVEF